MCACSSLGDSGVRGLGRSLDAYLALDLPKDARAKLDDLARFVIEAAGEWANRNGEKLAVAFPAVATIARKRKKIVEGLDAAVVEFMLKAGIRPDGKRDSSAPSVPRGTEEESPVVADDPPDQLFVEGQVV